METDETCIIAYAFELILSDFFEKVAFDLLLE